MALEGRPAPGANLEISQLGADALAGEEDLPGDVPEVAALLLVRQNRNPLPTDRLGFGNMGPDLGLIHRASACSAAATVATRSTNALVTSIRRSPASYRLPPINSMHSRP